jgi:two-component system sensor histidine kinase BaeS
MSALNSLRTRLFGAIAVVVVSSIGLMLAVGTTLTSREVERTDLRSLSRQADLLAAQERKALLPLARLGSVRASVEVQGDRLEVARLDGSSPFLPPSWADHVRRGQSVDGTLEVDGVAYLASARPVARRALVLLRPKSLLASADRPFREALVIAALLGAALAAVAAFLLARALARPLRRVSEASGRLASEREPKPVAVEGPNELRLLAESFNAMIEELKKARDAERAFLLSVSHELKTPLTAIRGYAEALDEDAVTADEAVATIRLESARLERLIQDLLDLARMNKAEFSFRSEPIDLADAAREVCRRYEQQARTFDVRLEAVADGPAPAQGDSDRVLQAVSNLVENALRLTPPGGLVRVRAEPKTLTVEDTGPGLREEELARAFERFYLHSRYGKERSVGTGLGLAIVKELAQGMGGSVAVETTPGRLTRFRIVLPPAEAPVLPTSYAERTSA